MIAKPPLPQTKWQPKCSICEEEKRPGELVNLTVKATYLDIKATSLTSVCIHCVEDIVATAVAFTKAKHGL